MVKWIIIPIIALTVIFIGWFLSRISKMADEFYQYAAIVNNKIDHIESWEDYYNAVEAYNTLIELDALGKGATDIMRLAGRLQEAHKQLINKLLDENVN